MASQLLQFFMIFFMVLIPLVSPSATYQYLPEGWMRLGGGYNPYQPTAGFAECISHEGEERKDYSGVKNSVATITKLSTLESYYILTHFSASLAGSYTFYSGSASYNSLQEDAFHSDTFTWILFFESKYGIFGLKNPKLKEEYKKLSVDELYSTCGSEIVIQQKKTAMAYALFTLKNISENHRKELETRFSGGTKTGIWSVTMDASFQNILRSALASSSLRIQIQTVGGRGISDLTDLIGPQSINEDGFAYFSKVPAALKKYVENITDDRTAPTEFQTASISVFRAGVPTKFNQFKDGQIATMYTLYEGARSIFTRADNILFGKDSSDYSLSDQEKNNLSSVQAKMKVMMNTIIDAAAPCFEIGGACQVPPVALPFIKWPQPAEPKTSKCEFLRSSALAVGCITQPQYDYASKNNQVPICTNYDIGFESELAGWRSCHLIKIPPQIL